MKRSKKARSLAAQRGWETRRQKARAEERARQRARREREEKRALEQARAAAAARAEERRRRARAREREEKRVLEQAKAAAAAKARKAAAKRGWKKRREKEAELAQARERLDAQERKREREIEIEQEDREDRGAHGSLPETWASGTGESVTAEEKEELYKKLVALEDAREAGVRRKDKKDKKGNVIKGIVTIHKEWREKKDRIRAALTKPAWEKLMAELGKQLASMDTHGTASVWSYILS